MLMQKTNLYSTIFLVIIMDINYFLNVMLEKIDWAILNTYLVDKKKKKK